MSSSQNAILMRLGYDPSDAKAGLQSALSDLADFKAKSLQLSTDLTRTQAQLDTQYSASVRAQAKQRLAELNGEISSAIGSMARKTAAEKAQIAESVASMKDEYAAQKQILDGYDQQIAKIKSLKSAISESRVSERSAGLAASILRPQAKAQTPFLEKTLGSINMGEILQATGILGLGASIPFAIHKLGAAMSDLAKDAGEYAEDMEQSAEKTGISVGHMQELDAVAHTVNLSSEDIVTSMRKLSTGILALRAGATLDKGPQSGMSIDAQRSGSLLKDLGVKAGSTEQVLLGIADAFSKMSDGATKDAVAVQLLGRSGINLIPLLNKGSEGFQEWVDQFSGFIPDLKNAADNEMQIRAAQEEYNLTLKELGIEVLPAVTEALKIFSQEFQNLANLLTKGAIHPQSAAATLQALGYGSNLQGVDEKRFNQLITLQSNLGTGIYKPGFSAAPGSDIEALQNARNDLIKRFGNNQAFLTPENIAAAAVSVGTYQTYTPPKPKENPKLQKDLLSSGTGGGLQEVESARQRLQQVIQEGEIELKNAAEKQTMTPAKYFQDAIVRYQEQLKTLQGAAKGLSAGNPEQAKELAKNLGEQADTERKIYELKGQQIEAEDELIQKQRELKDDTNALLQEDIQRRRPQLLEDYGRIQPAPEPAGGKYGSQVPGRFESQYETLSLGQQLASIQSLISPEIQQRFLKAALGTEYIQPTPESFGSSAAKANAQAALPQLKQLQDAIANEIKTRIEEGEVLGPYLGQLKALGSTLVQVNSEFVKMQQALEDSPVNTALEAFKSLGEAVKGIGNEMVRKDVGLGTQIFGQTQGVFDMLGKLGMGNPSQGLIRLFTSSTDANGHPITNSQRAQGIGQFAGSAISDIQGMQEGPLAGAAGGASLGSEVGSFGGPLGGLIGGGIGALGGALAGLFGGGKQVPQIAQNIRNQITQITDALSSGTQGIAATIQQLQAQEQQLTSQLSGKKGGQKELNQMLPQLQSQIAQLQGQQQQTMTQFQQQLAVISQSPANQQFVQNIVDIANALKQAAQAGASTTEQINYLNASLANLQSSTNQSYLQQEQQVLALMQQDIQLQQQKATLLEQQQATQLSITAGLALTRAQSPAQQAALQIRMSQLQTQQQLTQLDQQKALVDAQLQGVMQTFGYDQQDLEVANAKLLILQQQVAVQEELNGYTIQQIQANQQWLQELQSGNITNLPAGVLPPNFQWPTGPGAPSISGSSGAPGTGGTTIQNPTITISLPGITSADPTSLAKALVEAITTVNLQAQQGNQ